MFNNLGSVQKSSPATSTIQVVFNNSGTVDVGSGTLLLSAGGLSSGGTYTAEAGATLNVGAGNYLFDAASSINGAGAVLFSGSSALMEVAGSYNVTGATRFANGTTNFPGAVVSVGNSLTISGGVANFEANSISVATMTQSNGTLLGISDVGITGQLTWMGGTMGDTGSTSLPAGATLALSGTAQKTLDRRTLNNDGAATWVDAGTFAVTNGAVINNQVDATFTVQTSASWSVSGVRGAFENAGALIRAVSSGTTTLALQFDNSGTVDVQGGTLALSGDGTGTGGSYTVEAGATLAFASQYLLDGASQVNGDGTVEFRSGETDIFGTYSVTGLAHVTAAAATVSFLNDASLGSLTNSGGTVNVGVGTTLTLTGDYAQALGTTNLDAATLMAGNVLIQGGTFFGSGTLNANVTLSGDKLNVGGPETPGILMIQGNYTQGAGTTLVIEIGGITAGTQYDQLQVSGTATLGGTLSIVRLNGYIPAIGDSFQILTFGTKSGDFATISGPAIGGNPSRPFDAAYDANDLTLTTVSP